MGRWTKRRDANEKAIIKALTDAGCTVAKLEGTGVPDLLVRVPVQVYDLEDLLLIMEVKETGTHATQRGTMLTKAQATWWAAWGAAPAIAESPEQALALVAALRLRAAS